MSSALLENNDYVILDGVLEMVSGIPEELQAQDFELSTNINEWFLGSNFGYPWFVDDSHGNNVGLLGTKFDAERAGAIISAKIRKSNVVQNIPSISFTIDKVTRELQGSITEILIPEPGEATASKGLYTVAFKLGG